ncbi:MAG: SPW repeat domain-containing protein [Gammaproteobacteria bacterium]
MKILNPRTHGYLDYVTVILFLVAPTVLGLTGIPAMLAYALAIIHLVMTLVTNFPLGVVKFIPFTIHGWVERVVGPLLIIVPFVLGFSTDLAARNFYVAIGVVIVLVGLVTDYKGTETVKAQT